MRVDPVPAIGELSNAENVCRLLPATAVKGIMLFVVNGVSVRVGGASGAVGNGDAGVGKTKYSSFVPPASSFSSCPGAESRFCFEVLEFARSSTQFQREGYVSVG